MIVYPARKHPDGILVIQPSWTLTFEDNFPGSSLDASKWTSAYWFGRTNSGNNELEWYLDANVTVINGRGVLTAKSETTVQGGTTYNYTSGIISSHDKFYQQYGYFEASVKIPSGQGLWPAFWMLPQDRSQLPELDIMEILGHQPSKVYFTEHYDSGGGVRAQHNFNYTGAEFSGGFHTFGMMWTSTFVRWYVDGVLRAQVTENIAAKPMYLLLNLAVGGTWPGPPDGNTVFPAIYEIDYVRAYSF